VATKGSEWVILIDNHGAITHPEAI
jgi:hypothetical protein